MQTARTRLAPTFVLVKRVLRVTVIPVKVNDQKNIDCAKTLVWHFYFHYLEWFAEFSGTVVSPFCSLLFCLQQIGPCILSEASGTSFVAGCTLYKTGGHLLKEVTINNCAFLCRCRSFNPPVPFVAIIAAALCRCFKAILLQCRKLA